MRSQVGSCFESRPSSPVSLGDGPSARVRWAVAVGRERSTDIFCPSMNAEEPAETEPAERLIDLLQLAGIAEVAGELLDVESLAGDSGESVPSVRSAIEQLDRMGLVYSGLDEGRPPMLLNAGRQYLTQRGLVTHEVLYFLPSVIDDLHARDALIHAGVILVDEFRYQLLHGDAVEHAAELVPPAFAQAVDQALALNLFAAAVALMTRLAEGSPAGCAWLRRSWPLD